MTTSHAEAAEPQVNHMLTVKQTHVKKRKKKKEESEDVVGSVTGNNKSALVKHGSTQPTKQRRQRTERF